MTDKDNTDTDTDTDPTTPPEGTDPPKPGEQSESAGERPGEKTEPEGDTFPRAYVEKLRQEAAEHRTKAKAAEEALLPLQGRLHTALVAGTGKLADPSDLAFDAAHLEDEGALATAIDELLAKKPHLATRRVVGDIGQGAGEPTESVVNLGGMLRERA